MDKYKLINQLIKLVDAYDKHDEGQNLEHFSVWLISMIIQSPEQLSTHLHEYDFPISANSDHSSINYDQQISRMLSNLAKFLKLYTKKALDVKFLPATDDFGFLATLSHRPNLSKAELIRMNYMETPSGTEVIKRLLRKELIEEYNDTQDKRTKRLKITEKGREVIHSTFPEMFKVAQIVCASLSDIEKTQLLLLLKKMDEHHRENFRNIKESSLNHLIASYQDA